MLGFRIPDADEAMLISGGKQTNADGTPAPFRVVLGHRKFVMPGFSHVAYMTLKQVQHEIQENCFTKEKIPVKIIATIAFKVPAEEQAVIDAGQRFLDDQDLMPAAVGQITAGALRGIVGEMTLEQIIGDRVTLQEKVFEHAKQELRPQGLQVDSLNISSIADLSPGASAIESLSTPHLAEIRRDATIATARAQADAAKAEQVAVQQQADYERQTEVTKAGYAAEIARANADRDASIAAANAERDQKSQVAQAESEAQVGEANAERDRRQRVAQANADAETGKAAATASQAGPLAQVTAQHEVAVAATTLAEQQTLQREQELKRDVIAPANADAERRVAEAKAEATATELKATALASSNRVQVDMEVVKQLPAVAQAIASEIRGANVTLLNGAEGLTEVAAGVVMQAKVLLDTLKTVRTSVPTRSGENGSGELEAVGSDRTE